MRSVCFRNFHTQHKNSSIPGSSLQARPALQLPLLTRCWLAANTTELTHAVARSASRGAAHAGNGSGAAGRATAAAGEAAPTMPPRTLEDTGSGVGDELSRQRGRACRGLCAILSLNPPTALGWPVEHNQAMWISVVRWAGVLGLSARAMPLFMSLYGRSGSPRGPRSQAHRCKLLYRPCVGPLPPQRLTPVCGRT